MLMSFFILLLESSSLHFIWSAKSFVKWVSLVLYWVSLVFDLELSLDSWLVTTCLSTTSPLMSRSVSISLSSFLFFSQILHSYSVFFFNLFFYFLIVKFVGTQLFVQILPMLIFSDLKEMLKKKIPQFWEIGYETWRKLISPAYIMSIITLAIN